MQCGNLRWTVSIACHGINLTTQKQSPRGVPRKRCSEIMQQIYRRTPMPKCDFNKVASNFIEIALLHGCSTVNLLLIFRTLFHFSSFLKDKRFSQTLECAFKRINRYKTKYQFQMFSLDMCVNTNKVQVSFCQQLFVGKTC